jgi:hypothetical protein
MSSPRLDRGQLRLDRSARRARVSTPLRSSRAEYPSLVSWKPIAVRRHSGTPAHGPMLLRSSSAPFPSSSPHTSRVRRPSTRPSDSSGTSSYHRKATLATSGFVAVLLKSRSSLPIGPSSNTVSRSARVSALRCSSMSTTSSGPSANCGRAARPYCENLPICLGARASGLRERSGRKPGRDRRFATTQHHTEESG